MKGKICTNIFNNNDNNNDSLEFDFKRNKKFRLAIHGSGPLQQ